MAEEIKRLAPDLVGDFFNIHSATNEAGWCFCSAWWVPTWQGWNERTAEQNRLIRDTLFQSGIFDGYLFYEDGQPIGWCQVVLRDHLTKLRKQFNLQSDSKTWAITCFLVIPRLRRHGKAARFLEFILDDLRDRGVERVEAFPRKGSNLDEMDLWNGPMSMFQEAGFTTTGESATRDVMILNLKMDQRTAGQDSKGEG